jgi:hypothetical protein
MREESKKMAILTIYINIYLFVFKDLYYTVCYREWDFKNLLNLLNIQQ